MWKLQHLASYKVNVIQHVILVTKTTFPANVLANDFFAKKIHGFGLYKDYKYPILKLALVKIAKFKIPRFEYFTSEFQLPRAECTFLRHSVSSSRL